MADLTALASLMPHTEWCVAEHYRPGLACDDPSCQNVRQDEAADLVANWDLLLAALAEAGVLEVEGSVRRGCGCRVREGNIAASCCYLVGEGGPDVPERRYVTAWQEAQP